MGIRFGDYTLYDEEVKVNSDGRKVLHVICECGKVDFKQERYLLTGRSTSCKSCASKKTAKKFPPPVHRTGCEGLSGTHFLHIRNTALKRKLPFELSPEFLWNMFEQQEGRCALTGIPIVLINRLKKQNADWSVITASLDRIDNSKGYQTDNVWWVHKEVNRLKNNYSLTDLLHWCKLILNKHGNIEPSIPNDIEVSMKVQRLDGDESNK